MRSCFLVQQAEDLTAALAACKAQPPQTDTVTVNRVIIFYIDKKMKISDKS